MPPATALNANAFIDDAIYAYRQGNLTLQDDTFADGWTEVLPVLTDGERRLGQLEGFTTEQLDEFIEFYPLEDLSLIPSTTGGDAPSALDDSVVGTPIPELDLGIFFNVPNPHQGADVTISEERVRHTLDGDPGNIRGGGHRYGTGRPRKTEFPESWTDQKILDAIRDIATGTDVALEGSREPGQVYIEGFVDGVEIRVVVSPEGHVLSAYPLEGPLVVRNPR
ncbi:EndoU domain-containing protein [Gymnodinialimonas sp. 2305UL16-5]|uniref:EndoU domain-containing protein n=1 Tax=Gymnodinialimonas mytili TaxID=3126503 RepID=UPI0030B1C169